MNPLPEIGLLCDGSVVLSAVRPSGVNLSVSNSLNLEEWDDWSQSHPDATLAHSAAWGRVLVESYGYRPLHWGSRAQESFAFMPVLEVDSPLTGRRGICLPF